MGQKFNLGNELKLAAQKVENIDGSEKDEYIAYELLDQCEWNPETIEESTVEEIKKSLMENGLLHNLLVYPKADGRYRILSGNTRYVSIGRAIEEGCTKFKAGVRCHVVSPKATETEQRILMEEANVKQRSYTPDKMRKAIERLTQLYKNRNQSKKASGEKVKGETKEVAETTGITQRQVQKYTAVNEKLIPELQELFDSGVLNLNKASNYAHYPEEVQKELVALVQDNTKASNDKINVMLASADQKEKEYKERLENMENEKSSLESNLAQMNTIVEEKDNIISHIANEKSSLEKQLEEMKDSKSNEEELIKLQDQIKQLESKEQRALQDKDHAGKELKEAQDKVKQLTQQLKEEKSKKPKIDLTQIEEKVVLDYQMQTLGKEIIEKLNLYKMNMETYKSMYGVSEAQKELLEKVKKLL